MYHEFSEEKDEQNRHLYLMLSSDSKLGRGIRKKIGREGKKGKFFPTVKLEDTFYIHR